MALGSRAASSRPLERDRRRSVLAVAGAAAWGFAEATLFFVVPDVLITWLAVRAGWRRATAAAAAAAVGAVPGAVLMWRWAELDHAAASAAVAAVPAISLAMMEAVRQEIAAGPAFWVLLKASVTGVPFKVVALAAPEAGLSLLSLAAMTAPARLLRFLLAAALATIVSGLLARRVSLKVRTCLLIAFWVAFYSAFWTIMPS